MAKKLKFFSELVLGFASALTLSYAASISPAHACVGSNLSAYDAEGNLVVSNCAEDESVEGYGDAGATISSEATFPHSRFLAGNEVYSNDSVDGLGLSAGNLVRLEGSYEYAAAAGNSVVFSGSVKRDLFLAGNALEITEGASVGRDVFAGANSVLIKANLNGNVFASGNRLVLENVTIDGNLTVDFDQIVVKGKVAISGTLRYNDNVEITGVENLTAETVETYPSVSSTRATSYGATVMNKFLFLLARLLVTIILLTLCEKFAKRLLSEFCLKTSWKYLALGLALLVAVPLASLFVMVTVVGLPLGLVTLGFYLLFAYLGTSVTGGVLGNVLAAKLFKKEKMHLFLKSTLGIVLLELLSLIPVVGGLITAVSTCFGFGYLTRKIFRQTKAKR